MALIKCKKCGKETSEKSTICNNCGAQVNENNINSKKKRILWLKKHILFSFILLVIVVISLIFVVCKTVNRKESKLENHRESKVDNHSGSKLVTINGDSMYPTLKNGEKAFFKKTDTFNRFDIVIIKTEDDFSIIKRIYGMPGETISITTNGTIYIDSKKIVNDVYAYGDTGNFESVTLKDNEYFVLGDNREFSLDSRNIGPISKDNIVGVVLNENKETV